MTACFFTLYPLVDVYDDIRDKLIAKGIPAEEIAYIHDAKTEKQKADLFEKSATVESVFCLEVRTAHPTNKQKHLFYGIFKFQNEPQYPRCCVKYRPHQSFQRLYRASPAPTVYPRQPTVQQEVWYQ